MYNKMLWVCMRWRTRNAKEAAIAEDTTLNNALTRGSTPGYAVSRKAECGEWCDDYKE